MNDLPIVDALILCDNIVCNKFDNKYYLHGLWTVLWAPEFPCHQPRICVYARFRDVWQDQDLFISLNRPSKESEYGSAIAVQQMRLKGDKDRTQGNGLKELAGEFVMMEFKEPGRYQLVIATKDDVIAHTSFQVGKVERKFIGG